jgi:histidinol-phosphate aminotransferase
MAETALSRRSLIQGAAILASGASAAPVLAQAAADAPADTPAGMIGSLTDAVYINANENPLGPCPAAVRALASLPTLSGRYGMSFAGKLEALFAKQNGLKPDYVTAHAGSYVPLRAACLAFTSADRPIAYAEPTFDSGFFAGGGKPLTAAVGVPLGPDYRPDVKALLAAAPRAGVYYLCNPNNPTGTSTTRAEVEWLLANKPADAVVLVDEAYIHYSDTPSCLDLVAKGADVIVLRTFSKIYGLAGLRIGLVAARPDLMAKIDRFANNIVPMPAAVAAEASLLDPTLVPARAAECRRIREGLNRWFDAKGVKYVPSQTNFMMVHVGRPGGEVMKALAARKIMISGPRKHMPDWVRISIGTAAEMEKFKLAFAAVMGLA